MNIALLMSADMVQTRPESVKIIQSFGNIWVHTSEEMEDKMYTYGEGAIIQGEESDIKDWLRPYDGIWVYKGSPMLEEFEVMHVK